MSQWLRPLSAYSSVFGRWDYSLKRGLRTTGCFLLWEWRNERFSHKGGSSIRPNVPKLVGPPNARRHPTTGYSEAGKTTIFPFFQLDGYFHLSAAATLARLDCPRSHQINDLWFRWHCANFLVSLSLCSVAPQWHQDTHAEGKKKRVKQCGLIFYKAKS